MKNSIHFLAGSAIPYILIFLILIQLFLPDWMPAEAVYHNRMDYNLILNNVNDTTAALEQIKLEIDRDHLTNYIIMLGDSVFYGSPGSSDQTPGDDLEQDEAQHHPGHAPVVFDLAFPAAQLGDMYTMLLWLDRMGISTDHVLFNVRYSTFIPRDPGPRSVFWWGEKLRELDPASFNHVQGQLENAGFELPKGPYGKFEHALEYAIMPSIQWMDEKDYIHQFLYDKWLTLTGKSVPSDALGDPRPWYEKQDLDGYLHSAEMKADYTDQSFDFTDNSPDIYFMDRIVQHQRGKDTTVVMTGTNPVYMKEYIEKPGYQNNLLHLKQYLKDLPFRFIDLDGAVSDKLFADHTHYTPEGYQKVAGLIYDALADEGKGERTP